jgi:hypothetical protein
MLYQPLALHGVDRAVIVELRMLHRGQSWPVAALDYIGWDIGAVIRTNGAFIRFLPYLHYKDYSFSFVLDKEMVDSENHTVDASTLFDQIVSWLVLNQTMYIR